MSFLSSITAQTPSFNPPVSGDMSADIEAEVAGALQAFETSQPLGAMLGRAAFDSAFNGAFGGASAAAYAGTSGAGAFAQPTLAMNWFDGIGTAALGAPVGDGYDYGPFLPGANDDSKMKPVNQGSTNACGTASLSMIMQYLGVPSSREEIDSEIRRVDQGVSPQLLISYAREHGLAAEGYNHGSWDEIKGYIERGIPVQTLINVKADGNLNNGHFVAVVGFRTDPKTGVEQIGFRNSADKGKIDWMDRSEFENKWHNHFAGFDNFFIAYAPGGTPLPQGRWDGIQALSALGDGVWNVLNNFDRIIHPDSAGSFVHGVIGTIGGAAQTIGAGIGFGVQTVGDWLDKKVGDVPVVGLFARPIGKLLDGVGAGIGSFFDGVGSAFNTVGHGFESLFKGDVGDFFGDLGKAGGQFVGGIFNAMGNVAGGVAGAAGNVASSIGDGVKAAGNFVSGAASAVSDFVGGLF